MASMSREERAEYERELDKALRHWAAGEGEGPMRRLCLARGLRLFTAPRATYTGALHQLVASRSTLPEELRTRSQQWLARHG